MVGLKGDGEHGVEGMGVIGLKKRENEGRQTLRASRGPGTLDMRVRRFILFFVRPHRNTRASTPVSCHSCKTAGDELSK